MKHTVETPIGLWCRECQSSIRWGEHYGEYLMLQTLTRRNGDAMYDGHIYPMHIRCGNRVEREGDAIEVV